MENNVNDNEKSKKKKSTWRLITMITLNGIFFFVELITGISTHSLALQTDAFNMLSDEASVIIGLVVHRYSKKVQHLECHLDIFVQKQLVVCAIQYLCMQ